MHARIASASFLNRLRFAGLAALLLAGAASETQATDFYKDKQIAIIVGSAPGGGYDAYSRLLARHLDRHVAGNPAVIVQNMEGGGGVRAANHVYNIAPRDGTVIATVQRATLIEPVFGDDRVKMMRASSLGWAR